MGFNPLKEKGIPLEKQTRSWKQLNSKPYDKDAIHPYSRTAGILMNGIEVEAALFMHQWARNTDDMDLRRQLAVIRRLEQEQQKAINWMIPADESVLEVTIGYEQVAVDLTAFLAQNEKDPYIRQALDFALLEDFDHLYRYANFMKMTTGKNASDVTKEYTEITVGRPTQDEHRHPMDDVRSFSDGGKADPMSILHIMTIVAAEQQTMNFYMNVGNRIKEAVGRGLYLEIGQIEEQHVTHYESLMDPRMSWHEMHIWHELNECWLYYSLLQTARDKMSKMLWELHLAMELEHLRIAGDMLKTYEKKDPHELCPKSFAHLFEFKSNIEYVRTVLEQQVDLTAMGTEFVPSEKMPSDYRYHEHQAKVNSGSVPSEVVIKETVQKKGKDYRQELAGPHPVKAYRQKKAKKA